MLPLVVLKKKILLKMEWVMKEKMKNIICKTVMFLCVMLLCAGKDRGKRDYHWKREELCVK